MTWFPELPVPVVDLVLARGPYLPTNNNVLYYITSAVPIATALQCKNAICCNTKARGFGGKAWRHQCTVGPTPEGLPAKALAAGEEAGGMFWTLLAAAIAHPSVPVYN